MEEVWKTVEDSPAYMVSNMGRVRRGESTTKVLSTFKTAKGYLVVPLPVGGIRRNRKVHRLVAQAFIPADPARTHVNHIDGNKLNNRSDNLEWVTMEENMQHASRIGLLVGKDGVHHASKLSPRDVLEIRKMSGMESTRRTAARYGVAHKTIQEIQLGLSWKHIA